jgi:hypothetical protein
MIPLLVENAVFRAFKAKKVHLSAPLVIPLGLEITLKVTDIELDRTKSINWYP